ncbi:KDO2-lipid IV(A) lauroyltransferase [Paraoerskovia marina]|uniref:KDO2-lipid IV(A) lauroyltransferase n=1 Tax=Paraoerskovia marina TaxID=545619 RepID=A0A1H1SIN4_9CELL|nr:phosphatidylinositol mannoside acyltransferase [Paraoerskovia marina]SDS47874.1 KDO2-lipid IV(A) lauroyltransferase [Paraoerskovia marina]
MIRIARSAFLLAWKHAHRVPAPVLRGAFGLGADYVWWRRTTGVRRLEANLRRARPEASVDEIRRLSRAGMRSYMRYYSEVLTLAHLGDDVVDARVRTRGADAVRAELADGRSPLLALGHLGNWDLAGAWAARHLAPVLTVAERLEPPELFDEFVALRNAVGIEIMALGDVGVFRDLTRAAGAPGRVLPLLADRDLTASGIEVGLLGERARAAAGPGALAAATGAPLFVAVLYSERLHGTARRAARSPWGMVIEFRRVEIPDVHRAEKIQAITQAWMDLLGEGIREHPEDWHMLQRVFVDDLDADRDAEIRRRTPADEGGAG